MLDQNSSAVECLPVAVSPSGQAGERRQGLALQMFDQIPPGCLAFRVADHGSEPLIERGEVVIIDNEDNRPEDGALFLCRYVSASHQSYRVLETFLQDRNISMDGRIERQPCWILGNHHRPRSNAECLAWMKAGRPGAFCDGPYLQFDGNASILHNTLLGRVIGILAPEIGTTDRE